MSMLGSKDHENDDNVFQLNDNRRHKSSATNDRDTVKCNVYPSLNPEISKLVNNLRKERKKKNQKMHKNTNDRVQCKPNQNTKPKNIPPWEMTKLNNGKSKILPIYVL